MEKAEKGPDYSLVKCPYFRRKLGRNLRCQGFAQGIIVNLCFTETGQQIDYMESFCNTQCWQGCPVAQAAAEGE